MAPIMRPVRGNSFNSCDISSAGWDESPCCSPSRDSVEDGEPFMTYELNPGSDSHTVVWSNGDIAWKDANGRWRCTWGARRATDFIDDQLDKPHFKRFYERLEAEKKVMMTHDVKVNSITFNVDPADVETLEKYGFVRDE